MDVMNLRLWVIFYLICFVAVLWATFLLVQGFMLMVSLSMVAIVIGFNFFLLFAEVRSHIRKKNEMQEFISASLLNTPDTNSQKRK
jgi:hypothetical protein